MATVTHGRLNGHSSLARRVDALESLAAASHDERQQQHEAERLWQALPEPLQRYLASLTYYGSYDARSMHAHWLLERALYLAEIGAAPLRPIAGWVLRHSWGRLGSYHAYRLYEARGMNLHDHVTAELSAQELLQTDGPTLHRLWVEDDSGDEWLRLWREQGTRDPVILERAGLGEFELELVEAAVAARP